MPTSVFKTCLIFSCLLGIAEETLYLYMNVLTRNRRNDAANNCILQMTLPFRRLLEDLIRARRTLNLTSNILFL